MKRNVQISVFAEFPVENFDTGLENLMSSILSGSHTQSGWINADLGDKFENTNF